MNEEIDALKTAGLPPMEFLVLPRVIALAIMMPLLTLSTLTLLGILGGMIVGVGGFDIGIREYFNATRGSLTLTTVGIGLFSSLFLVSLWQSQDVYGECSAVEAHQPLGKPQPRRS